MMMIKPGAGIFIKLSRAGEYDKANLCVAEDFIFGFVLFCVLVNCLKLGSPLEFGVTFSKGIQKNGNNHTAYFDIAISFQ